MRVVLWGSAAAFVLWAVVSFMVHMEWLSRPLHAEWRWRPVCVAEHSEIQVLFLPVTSGNTTTIQPQYIPQTICDRYEQERYCQIGRDQKHNCEVNHGW